MSLVDNTAEKFLRIAAARWPADLREDQSREWAGELYAIRHDDDSGRLRRAWTQLRFAFSLAASPPVTDPSKIPTGWRELMPQLGQTMRRVLLLVAIGGLCAGVQTLPMLAGAGLGEAFPGFGHSGYQTAFGILAALVVAAVLCDLGRRLGRVLPLTAWRDRRFGAAATAGLVVLCLGAAPFAFNGDIQAATWWERLAFPIWAVPFAVLLAFVFRLAASGALRKAWGLAVAGGLLLLEVVAVPIGLVFAYVGPFWDREMYSPQLHTPSGEYLSHVDFTNVLAWFPLGLGGESGTRAHDGAMSGEMIGEVIIAGLTTVIPTMIAMTAFAAGYLVSSARAVPAAERAGVPAAPAASVSVSTARTYAGLAVTAFGIALWAVVLGFLVPISNDYSAVELREFGYWGIVLAAVGLVWARLGQPGAGLAGLLFGAGALVAGVVIDRADPAVLGAFLLTAGVGGALAVGAWFAAAAATSRRAGPGTPRRTAVAVAVLAGYLSAGTMSQARFPSGFNTTGSATLDAAYPILATVLAAAFAAVAVAAVWTAREPKLSKRSAILLLGPLAPLMAVLGLSTFSVGAVLWNASVGTFLLLPLTIYLTAVIRWGECERTAADYLKWGGGMLVAALGATFFLLPQGILGSAVGDALVAISAPGLEESLTSSLAPGLLLAAAALSVFISTRTVREPRPEPSAESARGSVAGDVATA